MSNKIKGYSTIGGVSKVTESGYVNIGGVWKPITEAYTNIGGVWKSAWETGERPISEFDIGSSVFMNVNGVSTEFIVIHQGLPSTAYDSSCNGTWLLMKDIYVDGVSFGSTNDYENGGYHSYLNNTFINLLDSGVKNVIKQVKIPYTKGVGDGGSVMTGSNGLSTKIFLLSFTETGLSYSYANVEGTALSYFKNAANSKRIAYFNGAAGMWALRSPNNDDTSYMFCISKTGEQGYATPSYPRGLRPACIIDSSTIVYGKNIV